MKTRPLEAVPSPGTGARHMPTLRTSMLSKAQPVTPTAPLMPVVLFTGVSKLPNGMAGVTLATLTWTCWGELVAPSAVTVIIAPDVPPPEGAAAVTWKVPLPVPDGGEMVTLERSEVAVQPTLRPPVMLTVTVCGEVINEPL